MPPCEQPRAGAPPRPDRDAGPSLCANLCFLLILSVCMVGCSDDDSPSAPATDTDFGAMLASYAGNVAVATYADLAAKSAALVEAASALAAEPSSQALLDDACQAWIDARSPWESGEAFLFGPAAFLSLDPSLDSWPVDRQQLSHVLRSQLELTPATVRDGLGPGLRGFHTIEYLLFRNGGPRAVTDLSPRELEYLVATCTVLADDATLLHDAWADDYAAKLADAGSRGSPYVSQRAAVLEIIEGMIGICDEVANGKIADPFDERDPELVESQFSWNSLTDFQDNMRSVMNAYTGGYHRGADGPGLDAFVREHDADLDQRLRAEIQAAIAAIAAIPEPFRDHLDQSATIEAAQTAIVTVFDTLERAVKPLVLN
ncbi:MAG: imelysin family protein [Candidatus Eiseniibacteriota bacterium]|jgi:uncharacterized iron-regulated protein